ncbi:unnamed protein product [Owenia fusiformis]|uniref:Uncharacterized protein n=1 Tax=Owenia fusiformis TaxID=6347 RepID=A0A8J1UB70_OWEFU|nr:unnamed protein product [Owenia fusiformis]
MMAELSQNQENFLKLKSHLGELELARAACSKEEDIIKQTMKQSLDDISNECRMFHKYIDNYYDKLNKSLTDASKSFCYKLRKQNDLIQSRILTIDPMIKAYSGVPLNMGQIEGDYLKMQECMRNEIETCESMSLRAEVRAEDTNTQFKAGKALDTEIILGTLEKYNPKDIEYVLPEEKTKGLNLCGVTKDEEHKVPTKEQPNKASQRKSMTNPKDKETEASKSSLPLSHDKDHVKPIEPSEDPKLPMSNENAPSGAATSAQIGQSSENAKLPIPNTPSATKGDLVPSKILSINPIPPIVDDLIQAVFHIAPIGKNMLIVVRNKQAQIFCKNFKLRKTLKKDLNPLRAAVTQDDHMAFSDKDRRVVKIYQPGGKQRDAREIGKGKLVEPWAIAVNTCNELVVADISQGNPRLLYFDLNDPSGKCIKIQRRLFNDAIYMVTNSKDDVIIADHILNTVICVNRDGKVQWMYDDIVAQPTVCVDSYDHVIVGDVDGDKIDLLSPDGKFIRRILSANTLNTHVMCVAVDQKGHLLVGDEMSNIYTLQYRR